MKNQKLLPTMACVACVAIASSVAAHAQTLIDFNIAPDGTAQTAAVLGTATDTYNNFGGAGYNAGAASAGQTLVSNAVSSNGANTGVAITTGSGFNTYTDNSNNGPINPAFLMDGYAFNFTGNGFNGPAATTLTLSGLTAFDGDTFTLVTYGVGNNSGEGNTFTLSGASTATGSDTGVSRNVFPTSSAVGGQGVAYQTFTGTITGDTLTIAASSNTTYAGDFNGNGVSDGVSEVNGFQLQLNPAAVPEPSAWAMMIGGLGLLFGIARFRRHAQV